MDIWHLWTCESPETETGEECSEGGGGGGRREGESWEEIIHQLTARSVIRDFEKMAEKEGDAGHGEAQQCSHRVVLIENDAK